jgi:hypothetical protein
MNCVAKNIATTVGYGKQILADIDDARMTERPAGLNHPAWLLLHLATAADYAAALLGGQGVCPAEWNALADTKKELTTNRADYPSKEELIRGFEAAYANASKLLQEASSDKLSQPQKLGFFESELPTVSDMATFLLVSHPNIHLGQLSAWRRAIGKSPLF